MGTAETYENVFRNKEPIPNSNDRYKMILEENAREQMSLFSPTNNNTAQRIGRLYGAGMNHPLIEEGLERATVMEAESGPKGSPIPKIPSPLVLSAEKQLDRHGEVKEKERGGRHANTISVKHSMTSKHQYPNSTHSPHIFNAYPSHDSGGGAVAGGGTASGAGAVSMIVPTMKTATALGMIDKQAGGKYHVPAHLHEPYSKPLTVSQSVQYIHTSLHNHSK